MNSKIKKILKVNIPVEISRFTKKEWYPKNKDHEKGHKNISARIAIHLGRILKGACLKEQKCDCVSKSR